MDVCSKILTHKNIKAQHTSAEEVHQNVFIILQENFLKVKNIMPETFFLNAFI